MPSPLGHAMAGAMTAWIAEIQARRSSQPLPSAAAAHTVASGRASPSGRSSGAGAPPTQMSTWRSVLADLTSPLAVTCAALAVLPDFDVFLHTHRTYSHSLGAAAIVWLFAALVAWRLRLPIVRTATICAAAYASHVLLDWLGRDDSRLAGPMALWPLTHAHFKSGADLFMEFSMLRRRRYDAWATLVRNAPALVREIAILGMPFVMVAAFRLAVQREKGGDASVPPMDSLDGSDGRVPVARDERRPRLNRARIVRGERG